MCAVHFTELFDAYHRTLNCICWTTKCRVMDPWAREGSSEDLMEYVFVSSLSDFYGVLNRDIILRSGLVLIYCFAIWSHIVP